VRRFWGGLLVLRLDWLLGQDLVARAIAMALDAKWITKRLRGLVEQHSESGAWRIKGEVLSTDGAEMFNLIADQVGGFDAWPEVQLTRLLSTHLNSKDRFGLTIFILTNGCDPTLYVCWLVHRRCLRDKSAYESIKRLLEQFVNGRLGKYTVELMAHRVTDHRGNNSGLRYVKVPPPPETVHGFYDHAHKMICKAGNLGESRLLIVVREMEAFEKRLTVEPVTRRDVERTFSGRNTMYPPGAFPEDEESTF